MATSEHGAVDGAAKQATSFKKFNNNSPLPATNHKITIALSSYEHEILSGKINPTASPSVSNKRLPLGGPKIEIKDERKSSSPDKE